MHLDVPRFSGEIEKAAGIQGASAFLLYYQYLRLTSFLTNSRMNHPSPLRNYFQRKWRLKEKQIHAIIVMPNTSLSIITRANYLFSWLRFENEVIRDYKQNSRKIDQAFQDSTLEMNFQLMAAHTDL